MPWVRRKNSTDETWNNQHLKENRRKRISQEKEGEGRGGGEERRKERERKKTKKLEEGLKRRKANLHRNEGKRSMLPRGRVANKKGVVLGLETGESSRTGAELLDRCRGLRHKQQLTREREREGHYWEKSSICDRGFLLFVFNIVDSDV